MFAGPLINGAFLSEAPVLADAAAGPLSACRKESGNSVRRISCPATLPPSGHGSSCSSRERLSVFVRALIMW